MAKPASRKTRRSGGSSIFTGVLIGLTVGAVLAVGVALWATGLNPFKFGKPAAVPEKAAPITAPPDTAPSFDFYKVLPGGTSGDMPTAAAPAAAMPQFYLQAGAFQNANDADNLKAQLALLGVEAAIQTGDLGSKGVFHRVRVGPFRVMDEINRTRSLLTQNNIPTTLVRVVPTQLEMP
jgi:cell division protein FtsN